MNKIWQIAEPAPSDFFNDEPELHPVFAQLLYNRGLRDGLSIDDFLHLEFGDENYYKTYDPGLFRDMEKSAEIIIGYIKAGRPIMIYGDYDADGVTASAVLFEVLKAFKAQVDVYLPDRVTEGYGLNKEAIDKIANSGFELIISVDAGIRNKAEAAYAKSLGLEIIITDHHLLPEDPSELPECLCIDPADPSDNYPFKYLAGVGVAFKLAQFLINKSKLDERTKKLLMEKNLDLVAIGTISDLVVLTGENRLLVKKGLEILNSQNRLGLKELTAISKIGNGQLDSWNVSFQLGPRLNAASRLEHANTALNLLLTKDSSEAVALAIDLNKKNIARQKLTEDLVAEVEKQIDPVKNKYLIVGVCEVGAESWNEGIIGLVAGRLSEKYYRPTLIITTTEEGYKGSGRSISEFSLVSQLEIAGEFLDKYGGHPMAAGFSVHSEEKLNKFLEKIYSLAETELAGQDLAPKLGIDVELKLADLNPKLAEQVEQLAPYGQGNPQPKFVSFNVAINDIVNMGKSGEHVKLRLGNFWALGFFKSEAYKEFKIGDLVDVVYTLDISEFNGYRELKLKIVDIRISK